MAKQKLLLTFPYNGVPIKVYLASPEHPDLAPDSKKGRPLRGCYVMNENTILLNRDLTEEARRTVLCHEVQHVVEEAVSIDHEYASSDAAESDERTNLLSAGWLYILRHSKSLTDYLRYK